MSVSVIPWTVAHQAPLSIEFSRQEYYSGLPFPTARDLPNPGIKPMFPGWVQNFIRHAIELSLYLKDHWRIIYIMSSSHSSSSLALVLFPALQFSPENCVQPFETAWSTRLLCPWDSPGKNTGVGCQFILQGIFPTQDSYPGLPHCRQILYLLSIKEAPGKPLW